ncbi:hypothetical protein [Vibrio barjaei]|uniref:hypothetical protein n=1 Tax=Vibrio barjaei TaxID=1676683 RepID=UPI002284D1E0|nr:hypothetical protein [Vibrio barjaei]MCY9870491.1 hypothetical protein [Vibrio barjaei]
MELSRFSNIGIKIDDALVVLTFYKLNNIRLFFGYGSQLDGQLEFQSNYFRSNYLLATATSNKLGLIGRLDTKSSDFDLMKIIDEATMIAEEQEFDTLYLLLNPTDNYDIDNQLRELFTIVDESEQLLDLTKAPDFIDLT